MNSTPALPRRRTSPEEFEALGRAYLDAAPLSEEFMDALSHAIAVWDQLRGPSDPDVAASCYIDRPQVKPRTPFRVAS